MALVSPSNSYTWWTLLFHKLLDSCLPTGLNKLLVYLYMQLILSMVFISTWVLPFAFLILSLPRTEAQPPAQPTTEDDKCEVTSPNPHSEASKQRHDQWAQEGKRVFHTLGISHMILCCSKLCTPELVLTPLVTLVQTTCTSGGPAPKIKCVLFQALTEVKKRNTTQHFPRIYYGSLLSSKTTNISKSKMENLAQKLLRMCVFNHWYKALVCSARGSLKKHCLV